MYIKRLRNHSGDTIVTIPRELVRELEFTPGKFVEIRSYNGSLIFQNVDAVLMAHHKEAVAQKKKEV